MKLVYLHQYFRTPSMGGGTRSYEFSRRLVLRGHSVDVITADTSPERFKGWRVEDHGGVRIHWVSVPYSNRLGFGARIRAFIVFAVYATLRARQLECDLVFASSTPLTIALPALAVSWWRRVPMVFEVRDLWPSVPIALGELRNPVLKWAARMLEITAYRRSAGVVALAPGMREEVIRIGRIDPSKVIVIPNACDTDIFGIDRALEVSSLRGSNAWLGSRRLVLFAGAFGRANGVPYIAEIAGHMRGIDPEVRFVIIGDGAERAELESRATQSGILGKTLFVLPMMSKHAIAAWFAASDLTLALFFGPSILYRDAVQNKFFDSLAAGKPVACNFLGFQSQVATEHGVGIVIPHNDPKQAANLIYSSLVNSEWAAEVPARCHELVKTRFSRDLLAAKLDDFLREAALRYQQFG